MIENIKDVDIRIRGEKPKIQLKVTFLHNKESYDGYLYYKNENKRWDLLFIYHKYSECCKHCIERIPLNKRNRFECHFLNQYINYIEYEILSNVMVKDKIKNFRLEALMSGIDF
jgi:hypothetical protein